jgi:hypothetical protein
MAAVFSRLPMRVRCATQRDHVFHPEMNYSQTQIDQLDRLTERWVADHLQKGKTSKKDKELVTLAALTELAEMINEMLRQIYYGGVIIDMRTQPPSVTSDPKVPANMVFVIDTEGKTTRYTSDRFSLDVLKMALKEK